MTREQLNVKGSDWRSCRTAGLCLFVALWGLVGCADEDAASSPEAPPSVSDTRAPPPPPPLAPLHFDDVSDRIPGLGPLQTYGVALVDLTGNGWVDLVTASYDGVRVYWNQEGTFEDATDRAGLRAMETFSAHGVVAADVDGDADLDLYISRINTVDRLLRNDGSGRFTDMSVEAGFVEETYSQGASFGDLDGDGDLDLYVAGGKQDENPPGTSPGAGGTPNRYYQNDGQGHFSEATDEAGLAGPSAGESFGSVLVDVDEDGDLDVVTIHDFHTDDVFLNDGTGHFSDTGSDWLDGGETGFMGLDVGDFNGDGRLDLFATDWGPDQALFGQAEKPYFRDRMSVLIGEGVSPGVNTTGWGCALADFDEDGDQDVMTTSSVSDGTGYEAQPVSRVGRLALYENLGWGLAEGAFVDATDYAGSALGHEINGYGLAVGDIDGDLDLDVVVGIERDAFLHNEPVPGLHRETLLLRNHGARSEAHNALVVHLHMPGSANYFAVGARLDVDVAGRKTSRVVLAGSSYLSANTYALHFGLGTRDSADTVTVTWPGGQREEIGSLSAGKMAIHKTPEGARIVR